MIIKIALNPLDSRLLTQLPHKLDYKPVDALSRRRVRRWMVAIIIGIVLVLVCYRQPLRTQRNYAQSWYWQRQCLHFELPPDTVVWQQCLTADEAAAMVATGRYKALPTWPSAGYPPNSVVLKRPNCFDSAIGEAGSNAIVFLHELTSPSGQKRLAVVLTRSALNPRDPHDYPPNVELDSYAYSVASWGQTQNSGSPRFLYFPKTITSAPHRLKIFAGQVDPNDNSHFTISYELDGEPGIIDGNLENSGLRLTFRNGPIP